MDTLHLRAVNMASGEVVPVDVGPLPARVRARALPGATAVHVTFCRGTRVVFQGEVACDPEEEIRLDVSEDSESGVDVACPGRDLFTLAPDFPVPPWSRPARDSKAIDVAFVVDGTARHCQHIPDPKTPRWELSPPLLLDPEAWGAHVTDLTATFEALARSAPDARAAVIAFGDLPMSDVSAPDLSANPYLLWPDPKERNLRACSSGELQARLNEVPAAPGGDFVDALGDAFAALKDLKWRDHARRVVVVTGDSPGHSTVDPVPPGLDAHVRVKDVLAEAESLFRQWGALVVTVYHDVPKQSGFYETAHMRDALRFARDQYVALASVPSLALRKSSFQPAHAVEEILKVACFGRGSCLPGV